VPRRRRRVCVAEPSDRPPDGVEIRAPLTSHPRSHAYGGQGLIRQVPQHRTAVEQQDLTDHRTQAVRSAPVAPTGQDCADLLDGIVDGAAAQDAVGQARSLETAEPVEGGELAQQVGVGNQERAGVGADLAALAASEWAPSVFTRSIQSCSDQPQNACPSSPQRISTNPAAPRANRR